MKTQMIITITCTDRPGIVHQLSEKLLEQGANLEASRMARLGGEFVGIIQAAIPENRLADIEARLGEIDESMNIVTRVARPVESERYANLVSYKILVTGADHEGIVHGVAQFLADKGVNIEELTTNISHAPIAGTPLFSMHLEVAAPSTLTIADFRNWLTPIAEEQGVDIEIMLSGV